MIKIKDNMLKNNSPKKNVSYGEFLKNNPKATKEERKKAISQFLNHTRK